MSTSVPQFEEWNLLLGSCLAHPSREVQRGCQGHPNGVKFGCQGHQNGVNFGCQGHQNGVKFSCWGHLKFKIKKKIKIIFLENFQVQFLKTFSVKSWLKFNLWSTYWKSCQPPLTTNIINYFQLSALIFFVKGTYLVTVFIGS